MGEIILGGILSVLVGGFFLHSFIMIPINFYKDIKEKYNKFKETLYRADIYKYADELNIERRNNSGGINGYLNDFSEEVNNGMRWFDVKKENEFQLIRNKMYQDFDPEFREDQIDDLLN